MYQKTSTPFLPVTLALVAVLAIILLVYPLVFWPSLTKMEALWRNSETYMHAYLIFPISVWLVWRERHSLIGLPLQTALWPALLTTPFAIVWLLAYAIDVNFVSQFAAIIFLQCLLWALLGHKIFRVIWFPVAFLIFLVPFGEAANPILQQATADMVVYLLHMVDFPVYREGLYIYTPSAIFEVAVACSGLNFLLTSLVLSCLYSYLHYTRWYKALAFIVFTLCLSIIANGFRAFLLVVIGEKSNLSYGFGADHYYYGWLVFFIVIMLAFWLGAKFSDNDTPKPPQGSRLASVTRLNASVLVYLSVTLATAGYISRNIYLTDAPEQAVQITQSPLVSDKSNWGITFFDGLSRDHWITAQGAELFMATYAHRQRRGDMITWHNTLYQVNQWSITEQYNVGKLLNSHGFLHLVNTHGQKRTLLYWYQLGDYKTSNRVAFKLLQLIAILQGNTSPSIIYAVSMQSNAPSDDIHQQLIDIKNEHLTGLIK